MTQDLYYTRHVFCCINQRPEGHELGCCADKGAVTLQNYMKSRAKQMGLTPQIRINKSGCLDRCALGPTMVVYPEGVWYRAETKADIDEILEQHVQNSAIVERLRLKTTE